jgi:hypothetical protein
VQDSGCLAVTPLYLYAGLAGPLMLVPRAGGTLERLSGVLALGIGDSAASWFGSNYGFNKWAGHVFSYLCYGLLTYSTFGKFYSTLLVVSIFHI